MFTALKLLQTSAADVTSAVEEVSQATEGTQGSLLSSLSPLLMLAVFGFVFYFFILRPEKKRKKEVQEQRDAMRVGDTVITIGGITGEIESIRTETITIFTGTGSIDVQKWAIRSVEPAEETEYVDSTEATEPEEKTEE